MNPTGVPARITHITALPGNPKAEAALIDLLARADIDSWGADVFVVPVRVEGPAIDSTAMVVVGFQAPGCDPVALLLDARTASGEARRLIGAAAACSLVNLAPAGTRSIFDYEDPAWAELREPRPVTVGAGG